jgi:hypothetical protein
MVRQFRKYCFMLHQTKEKLSLFRSLRRPIARFGGGAEMAKIISIEARTMRVPLARPTAFARLQVMALRYMDRFADYDPYGIEEPFSPDQIDNHAKLAAAIAVPVATGEIEAGRWRFTELLDKGAAAILQTDAAVCGGITEYRRIAALADAYGVTMCPYWFHDLHVHLVAAGGERTVYGIFSRRRYLQFPRPDRYAA